MHYITVIRMHHLRLHYTTHLECTSWLQMWQSTIKAIK